MIQEAQTVTLAADWLEESSDVTAPPMTTTVTSGLCISGNAVTGNTTVDWGHYWAQPTYWNVSYTTPTKIRLKMSEVEKLRAAAKRDKALREVLEKFGPHIEVEVDFG